MAQTQKNKALSVKVGDGNIPVRLSWKKGVKRITLRYNSKNQQFSMTVPRSCNQAQALEFLKQEKKWIDKIVKKEGNKENIPLIFGSEIPVLGQDMVIKDDREAKENAINILAASDEQCEHAVIRILKKMLYEHIEIKAREYSKKIGKEFNRISLRDTSSRWGSCSSAGNLNFSWRLVFAPLEVLDYVIAHEVSHLAEHNHSPEFWKIVDSLDPEYKQNKKWLRDHGSSLFRYGT